MDQTSQTAAVVVPIAAAFGLMGLVLIPSLAIRSVKHAICPERARREAAERAAAQREGAPLGGAATIGTQRRAEEHATR
ncbi:hypothetical protein [Sporichthya polymorpha]|uniref:hypothetical protein n=1 Tax=Sporichthya polymorpha TaxID=35751 RepID=UPI000377460C|nr:hypothetical protein [Sporichthya polymorpha]